MSDFESPAPYIPRGQYERPLIKQPDGSTVPYYRASVFAKSLDNGYGLMIYKLRWLALGLGRREDLAAIAAGLTYERGDELDALVEKALEASGCNEKANYGTAIHLFTEPGAPDCVPVRMADDVAAYNAALERDGITVLATEQFVVNDSYRIGGTFDHIYHHPRYGRCVGDKKTGRLDLLSFTVQQAIYANSYHYDPETGDRAELDVNKNVALVVHIPAEEGTCTVIPVDIRAGYQAVKTAAEADFWRHADFRVKHDEADDAQYNLQRGGLIEDALIAQIRAAANAEALNELWRLNRHAWTERHTAVGNAHLRTLEETKK